MNFDKLKKHLCPHGAKLVNLLEIIESSDTNVLKDSILRDLMDLIMNSHEHLHLQEELVAVSLRFCASEELKIATGKVSDETILFYAKEMKDSETRVAVEYQHLFETLVDGAKKRIENLTKIKS